MSADLIRELNRLGDDVWPETPDLEARVLARLDEPPPRRHRRGRLAVAIALALLVPAAGAVAFPGARDDVLDWIGLKSVEVEQVDELPPAAPNAFGDAVTLQEAERRAGFAPLLPPALGKPAEIRERAGVVTVVYGGGIRLAQQQGALDRRLLRKIVTPGNQVRAVPGGLFIRGEHVYLYVRPDGSIDEARTTGTALIVQRGDLLLRLEGVESYERARALIFRSG